MSELKALLINLLWFLFIMATIKWRLPNVMFLSIFVILFGLTIWMWATHNDDNGGRWNDGGDDNPEGPSPDPDDTKKLIEKVIRESREKTKNPANV